MKDETLEQLMILVERVVRPIRTGGARKRRMREELMDHATFAFEEEMQEGAGVVAAIDRVRERLGDPARLSVQLQESVGLTERIQWRLEHALRFRSGESLLRRAARNGLFVWVTMVLELLLLRVPLWLWFFARTDPSRSLPFLMLLTLVVSAIFFVFTLLAHGLRLALFLGEKRSLLRGSIFLMSASATFGAAFYVIGLTFLPGQGHDPTLVRDASILTAIAPLGVLLLAWQTSREIRYEREWQTLQIDE